MKHSNSRMANFAAGIVGVLLLAGCAVTSMEPTIQAMPGPDKSTDTFQGDQTNCKTYAAGQVEGLAEAANQGAVGAGAAIGAATSSNEQIDIQQQYDNAFAECMYAHGEQVPGYASLAPPPPVAMADPLVRSTQSELIRLGYLRDTANGYLGPRTVAAVSSFQQANGLPVDGRLSPRLLAVLQSTPTSRALVPSASTPPSRVAPAGVPNVAPPSRALVPSASAPSNWVTPAGSPSEAPPATQPATPPPAPDPMLELLRRMSGTNGG
jgi:hypothetical protein